MTALEVSALRDAGHDVVWADADLSIRTNSDAFHAQNAQEQGRVLVTRDSDLGTLKVIEGVPQTGLVFIRGIDTKTAAQLLPGIVKDHAAALSRGAQITVGANRVRVREHVKAEQAQGQKSERQRGGRPGRSRSDELRNPKRRR